MKTPHEQLATAPSEQTIEVEVFDLETGKLKHSELRNDVCPSAAAFAVAEHLGHRVLLHWESDINAKCEGDGVKVLAQRIRVVK